MAHSTPPNRLTHNLHAPHLYRTPDGSVMHCNCCGRIQVAFRGLTLLITVKEFDGLCRTVAQVWEDIDPEEDVCSRRVSADTDAGEVSVTLQIDELRALRRLFNGAYAMMTLQYGLQAVANGAGRNTVTPSADRSADGGAR